MIIIIISEQLEFFGRLILGIGEYMYCLMKGKLMSTYVASSLLGKARL